MSTESVDPNAARGAARELFLLLHRGQGEWFDLAWELVAARGSWTHDWTQEWRMLPGLGATAPDPATQQMARDFAALAATFLIESAMARDALLARLKEASTRRGHGQPVKEWIVQAAGEILGGRARDARRTVIPTAVEDAQLSVWEITSDAALVGLPEACRTEDVADRFWSKRGQFHLFIHGRMVFAPKAPGDNEIQMKEDEYRTLVTLLLRRGQPVKPMLLYKVVYRHAGPADGLDEVKTLTNTLRPLISRVRRKVGDVVSTFCIPDLRKLRGYAVKGAFDACVVLDTSDVQSFRLPEA